MDYSQQDMHNILCATESEHAKIKEKIVDIKARSMRDNLIITNIPEEENETTEQTEQILRKFICEGMKLNISKT